MAHTWFQGLSKNSSYELCAVGSLYLCQLKFWVNTQPPHQSAVNSLLPLAWLLSGTTACTCCTPVLVPMRDQPYRTKARLLQLCQGQGSVPSLSMERYRSTQQAGHCVSNMTGKGTALPSMNAPFDVQTLGRSSKNSGFLAGSHLNLLHPGWTTGTSCYQTSRIHLLRPSSWVKNATAHVL